MSEASWYVVHTYSGYENKVKMDIEKTIENRKLQDQILEVSVPTEKCRELKNDTEKEIVRKIFPGYVFVRMVMNDETWYVVRNTRGVTGFVGPNSKPVPLAEEELKQFGFTVSGSVPSAEEETRAAEVTATKVNFEVGDIIVGTSSSTWAGTVAAIKSINEKKQSVMIETEMFGRPTQVELKFTEIKKKD